MLSTGVRFCWHRPPGHSVRGWKDSLTTPTVKARRLLRWGPSPTPPAAHTASRGPGALSPQWDPGSCGGLRDLEGAERIRRVALPWLPELGGWSLLQRPRGGLGCTGRPARPGDSGRGCCCRTGALRAGSGWKPRQSHSTRSGDSGSAPRRVAEDARAPRIREALTGTSAQESDCPTRVRAVGLATQQPQGQTAATGGSTGSRRQPREGRKERRVHPPAPPPPWGPCLLSSGGGAVDWNRTPCLNP